MSRPGTAPSKAAFEKSVQDEQLERSDFTIFTHDLKKTCDGFYNAVRANLPSIPVEEVTDDEDEEVAPVFSNLQLNDKGEYVGRLQVGPLLNEPASSAAPGSAKPHISSLSPAGTPPSRPAAFVAPAIEAESSSSDDNEEMEQVVDASELRRRAMGEDAVLGASKAADRTPVASPTTAPRAAAAAPLQLLSSEPGKQLLLEKDLEILKQAEEDLHNAMLERPARKDAVPRGELQRDPAEQAEADERLADAVKNTSAVNVEIEAAKGLALAAKGEHAKAVTCLSAAIEGAGILVPADGAPMPAQKLNVRDVDAVKWLVACGRCYLEMAECYNAVPKLEKAVALDPVCVEARLQYAISLRFSCRYVEASEQVKLLLRLDPEHRYGRLEERRLQQRLAHAQGQDLDTWRRKDSVISTAKEIQARAERSIEESRSKVENLSHKRKEKELEEDFFRQIAQAKEQQEAERARLAELSSGAILDVHLGGIDVDDLLRELHEMQPDPNIFANVSPRPTRGGVGGGISDGDAGGKVQPAPSLPPLLQALVGDTPLPGAPVPAATAPNGSSQDDECDESEDLAREEMIEDSFDAPTALEVGAGARAMKSNVSGMFESADSLESLLVQKQHAQSNTREQHTSSPPPSRASAVGPRAQPAAAVDVEEEQARSAPIEKGSIGAKLRALREGRISAHAPPPSTTMSSTSDAQQAPGVSGEHKLSLPGGTAAAQADEREKEKGGVRSRGAPVVEPPKMAPTPKQRRELAMQLRAQGRMALAGSDEDEDDSEEEEDLMALRSKLKERSKKLSPEEQEAQDRKDAAQRFLEERARQDREERERRRVEEEERKKAQEARQKQLDDLAAESARKRREMDREREERERKKAQEETRRRRVQAAEEEAALEEEEEAMLKEKALLAAARARSVAHAPAEGDGGAGRVAAKKVEVHAAGAADDCEIEEEEEEEDDKAEERLMQERLKEAQRLREERLSAAASRHKRMLELSKGPMATLPNAWFFELSQREALEVVPDFVGELCVLLLPDMDTRLLASVLHWMVTPGSLSAALEHAGVKTADRDDYGDVVAAAGANPAAFPFQVVGLSRGALPKEVCVPALLPKSTQKRMAETGEREPVVMLALGQPESTGISGAAATTDLVKAVTAALAAVSLETLYLWDTCSAPTHDVYSGLLLSSRLDSVASVIGGKSAVSPAIKSPLFWFACAPAGKK